jgi:hypothetical protein
MSQYRKGKTNSGYLFKVTGSLWQKDLCSSQFKYKTLLSFRGLALQVNLV